MYSSSSQAEEGKEAKREGKVDIGKTCTAVYRNCLLFVEDFLFCKARGVDDDERCGAALAVYMVNAVLLTCHETFAK